MEDIICYNADGEVLQYFTQWDVNQKLIIKGADISSSPIFHFQNANIDVAYTVQSTIDGEYIVTSVPDILLQYDVPLIVFVEYEYGTTEYSIRIPIMPRSRPTDYIITDGSGSGPGSGSGSPIPISIINNLTTQNSNAALSAMQGYILNEKIKNIEETKVDDSDVENIVNDVVSNAIKNLEIPSEPGRGIVSIDRTSGDGGPGSVDTYTITYTDNTTSVFKVYNGIDGVNGGSGDGTPSSVIIVDNLTTNNKNAALSASQGLILKEYIDELDRTKISSDDLYDIISDSILNSSKNYIELLPKTSCSVSEDTGTVDYDGTIKIRAGKTYLVLWNGVEYKCDASKYNDKITILGGADYPFHMECFADSTDIYPDDGSTSVTIAIYEEDKFATEGWVEQKLDAAFDDIPSSLPNPGSLTFVGAVTGSYNGAQDVTVEIPEFVGIASIKQTTMSNISGAENVITATLSNGKTSLFKIRNGAAGQNGANGVSVTSVTQTTTATDDDGENIITVSLSDGTVSDFKIKNGSRGSTGANATINGLNALTIDVNNGITKSQSGNTLTISGDLTGLLASGQIILRQGTDYHYGDTLPDAGTEGRLFFLKK